MQEKNKVKNDCFKAKMGYNFQPMVILSVPSQYKVENPARPGREQRY